jgi:tRNA A37 threonylcarbamoyladenosine modification protein TsaB
MIQKTFISLGLVPSHHCTVIYYAINDVVSIYEYIENNLFLLNVSSIIDKFLIKNNIELKNIDFISFFEGPVPLMTMRTVLAWAKGISISLHIPIKIISGVEYFQYDYDEAVIINIFNQSCSTYYKNKQKIMFQKDIALFIKNNSIKKISFSKNIIFEEYNTSKVYQTVIFPDINKIAQKSFTY